MYCKKCGCKLNSSASVCPECGSETTTEYCGGFWGIINEKGGNEAPRDAARAIEAEAAPPASAAPAVTEPAAPAAPAAAAPAPVPPAPLPKSEKRSGGPGRALSVLLALALIFSVIQTVRLSLRPTRAEVKELEATIEEQEEQIEEMKGQQEVLEEVIEKLKSREERRRAEENGDADDESGEDPGDDANGGQYSPDAEDSEGETLPGTGNQN